MIEPYAFVRAVTIGLGATWTVTGLVRVVRFARRWKSRLAPLHLEERWWRRQIAIACLRATVLDPVNLGLLCLLAALWSVRAVS